MSNDDPSAELKQQINDFHASITYLMKNAIERSKRSDFATVQEYVAATRCESETIDGRSEYFSYALNKLREVDSRLDALPLIHFISTLNMNSSVVDVGAGPVLLLDLYQSVMLEEMGRLFLGREPPHVCGAFALRLLAEHYIACGKQELAVHFAVRRSILVNDHKAAKSPIVDQTEVQRCSAVQDVFFLTHEVGHILWSQNRVPKEDFVVRARQWICVDTQQMAFVVNIKPATNTLEGASEPNLHNLKTVVDKVSPVEAWRKNNSPYAPEQIQATLNRRCDPCSGFIEEVWADFYAWTSCMRLFLGNWPSPIVYRDMSLAMRNLAAIDAIRRIAERDTSKESIDDVSTRRKVLRIGLRTLLGDLRANDDFRHVTGLREEDLAVDFAAITVETDQTYEKVLWDPMMEYVFASIVSIPDRQKAKHAIQAMRGRIRQQPSKANTQKKSAGSLRAHIADHDQGGMLARMSLPSIDHLADVEAVAKKMRQRAIAV